ncbi:methyltransferase domain-containing protein [Nocardioides sp. zg-579]|uniref:Methyltransferase domain-containing protein n=1 Tax=Nocardioides marmotae TaxID=2663857 RepID=A0A6I3JEA3_9ACTN|nr:methyltransferase domain-containing protein [Nocardioides marmotae]MCR6032884.1 methyltransferase domain-containing protein [Gordonia jinghuaiqii]MTB96534.1 methyltransferase domain-containing protein [Nocardioides marmotae]QKE01945.1 class I SAM-dependent methyltransferase [Nocardioides marmotae]
MLRRSPRSRSAGRSGTSGTDRPAGPATNAARGSLRLEQGFFDRFPAFLETSETSSFPWRLNLRHEAIVTAHAPAFVGARVLDIASHDGRWSMAALEAGASHVTGIEARPELVDQAEATFRSHDVPPDRYTVIRGDVFEVLAREDRAFDVVLCLGFLYHTLRHGELFARIRATGARQLIVDTEVHRSPDPLVRLATEHVDRQGNAVPDEFNRGASVITGRPSLSALELLASSQGYALAGLSDWDGLLRDNPDADQVRDYRIGRRLTAAFTRERAGGPGDR